MLLFEWDQKKAKQNKNKHNVSFELAKLAFDDPLQLNAYDRTVKGEDRFATLAIVGHVLLFVAHSYRKTNMVKKSSASSQQGKRRAKSVGNMSAELAAELKELAKMSDEDIDTSDLPEKPDWTNAEVGKFYRPVKKQVSMRVDADVLDWFQRKGSRYTALMNQALRSYIAAQEAAEDKKRPRPRTTTVARKKSRKPA